MEFLTSEEVAKILNISGRTACKLGEAKVLPGATKIGKQWRFRKDILMNWLIQQTGPEASAAGLKADVPVHKQHPSSIPR